MITFWVNQTLSTTHLLIPKWDYLRFFWTPRTIQDSKNMPPPSHPSNQSSSLSKPIYLSDATCTQSQTLLLHYLLPNSATRNTDIDRFESYKTFKIHKKTLGFKQDLHLLHTLLIQNQSKSLSKFVSSYSAIPLNNQTTSTNTRYTSEKNPHSTKSSCSKICSIHPKTWNNYGMLGNMPYKDAIYTCTH